MHFNQKDFVISSFYLFTMKFETLTSHDLNTPMIAYLNLLETFLTFQEYKKQKYSQSIVDKGLFFFFYKCEKYLFVNCCIPHFSKRKEIASFR